MNHSFNEKYSTVGFVRILRSAGVHACEFRRRPAANRKLGKRHAPRRCWNPQPRTAALHLAPSTNRPAERISFNSFNQSLIYGPLVARRPHAEMAMVAVSCTFFRFFRKALNRVFIRMLFIRPLPGRNGTQYLLGHFFPKIRALNRHRPLRRALNRRAERLPM